MEMRQYSWFFLIAICLMSGYLVGRTDIWHGWFIEEELLFVDAEFSDFSIDFNAANWQQLLGEQDKQLFTELRKQQEALELKTSQQPGLADPMEASLLMSALKANTWHALDGYQVNKELADKWVKIPGFMVPLEVAPHGVSSFFIVPYFGACLHFPPPTT